MSAKSKQIIDMWGNPISRGSIVQVGTENLCLYQKEGLVLDPHHTQIEGPEYHVVVFFNTEIELHHFNLQARGAREWCEKYDKQCSMGDTDFLFEESQWKQCPRIVFCKPEDLSVQLNWSHEVLARRIFGRRWHHLSYPNSDTVLPITSYMCWSVSCENPATKIAIHNVWGTVYFEYVCEACFEKMHGLCSDGFKMKKIILLKDGTVP